MRIIFEPAVLKTVNAPVFLQDQRVLSDEAIAKLDFGSVTKDTEITLTAYQAKNGDVLIFADGKAYLKRFIVHSDGKVSSELGPEDQRNFETELRFHEAKSLQPEISKLKEKVAYLKAHKKEELKRIEREGPHQDGVGNPLTLNEAYNMNLSEIKNGIRDLEKNLKLDVKTADSRVYKIP